MKAIRYTRFGGPEVLTMSEVPDPQAKSRQVRIKIAATTVTAADCLMRKADSVFARLVLGLSGPRRAFQIPGIEFSGWVDQVGDGVTKFGPGQPVYGFAGWTPGTYAEYICLSEDASLAILPEKFSMEEGAAIVDGATTAIFFLRDLARIQAGQRVLVVGASGSIGTAAVQIAKYLGAEVTAVCSAANTELVRGLGADKTIDYTSQDYTQVGERYDIVFDTVAKSSFAACRPILAPKGTYLTTVPSLALRILGLLTRLLGGKRLVTGMSVRKHGQLRFLNRLVEEGAVRPVIDRYYRLEDIPDAHSYVERGHKKGNVVVRVGPERQLG